MSHLSEREELDLRRQLKGGVVAREELDIRRRLKESEAIAQTGAEAPTASPNVTPISSFGVTSGRGAMQLGRETVERMEAAVQQRQNQLTDILGEDNFLAGEGLNDFLLRADLARSDKFSEKRKKFLQKHPQGQFIAQPLGNEELTILFREDRGKPFREVSPLKSSPIPNVGDLGTIAGIGISEPVVSAGIGFALGGPVIGAFAAGAGVLNQSQIEKMRGFEDTPRGEVRTQAVVEGVSVLAGDAALRLGRRAVTAAGAGNVSSLFTQRTGARRAATAAHEEGLPAIMTGQTAKSPLVRGAFQQTAGTSPIAREGAAVQRIALRGRLQEQVSEESLQALTNGQLGQLIIASSEELDRIVVPYALATSKGAGVNALDRSFNNFVKTSDEWVGRRYEQALSLTDDVAYTLGRAQNLAKEINTGVLARARTRTAAELTELQGRFPKQTQRVSRKPTGELKSVIDDLLAINPVVSKFKARGKEFDAFTQIRTVRSRLFDLKQSSDPFVRDTANKLWVSVTEAMDNPISGDPKFVNAYRAASNADHFREGILSLDFVRKIVRGDIKELGGAASVVNTLIQPGSFNSLQLVKRLMPEQDFRVLQDYFKSQLKRDPGKIQAEFRKYRNDPRTLQLLMSKDEIAAFEEYGFKMANLEKGPLQNIFQSDLDLGERALEFANTATRKQMADIVTKSGGPNSEFARSIKSGIYQRILDTATVIDDEGVTTLSPSIVTAEIKKLRPKLGGLFSPEDWRRLENFEVFSAVTSQTTDVGGQMQAGSVRAAMTNFLNPLTVVGGIHTMVSNRITGRILSSPVSYRVLQSAPGKGWQARRVRAVTAAAVVAMQQAQAGGTSPDSLK